MRNQYRGGGTPKKFIGYEEIATFLGISPANVRQLAHRKKLDPRSLASIYEFHNSRRKTQHE